MKTLYIHAGAHKTASSMLQTALRVDKEALFSEGLKVIFRSQIINREFQKSLYEIRDGNKSRIVKKTLKEDLKKILPNREVNCLITSEDLFSTIDINDFYNNIEVSIKEIKSVAESLGWNVKFLFYVRNQPDYIESVYLQNIHLGKSLSFEEFIGEALPHFLDWRLVIDKVVKVLGKDNVKIDTFESIKIKGGKKYYTDFLEYLGVKNTEKINFDESLEIAKGANRSYSSLAIDIAKRVNPLLNKDEKRLLRFFLQENFSTSTHEKAKFLDDSQREELIRFYTKSNVQLFDEYLDNYEPNKMGYV